MKRLTTILLWLACMAASAQGSWITGINEADELKGIKGGPYYIYEVKGIGSFVVWDWKDPTFRINTTSGQFNVWYYTKTGDLFVEVKMGLYTMDGKLTEKFEDRIQSDIHKTSAWLNKKWIYGWSQDKAIKKMLRALKEGTGYVRIVCQQKGAPDFDLKVMPYVEPAAEEESMP